MELVSRSNDSGIAVLSLNRPDMLNALSPNLFNELRVHIDAIAEQPDEVGCVILRGEGRRTSAFSVAGVVENEHFLERRRRK